MSTLLTTVPWTWPGHAPFVLPLFDAAWYILMLSFLDKGHQILDNVFQWYLTMCFNGICLHKDMCQLSLFIKSNCWLIHQVDPCRFSIANSSLFRIFMWGRISKFSFALNQFEPTKILSHMRIKITGITFIFRSTAMSCGELAGLFPEEDKSQLLTSSFDDKLPSLWQGKRPFKALKNVAKHAEWSCPTSQGLTEVFGWFIPGYRD